MNDDRFDVSADMRLVDLQREALGVPARQPTWTSRSNGELPHPPPEPPPYAPAGTILLAIADAQPRTGVIAGALVNVAIALHNEGASPADGIRVALPLPFEAVYHRGTATLDGAPLAEAAADDFFGDGFALGTIAPGERRTLLVKLRIEPGTDPVTLAPHVTIARGAVLGPRSVRLERAKPSAVAFTPVIERPFYEPEHGDLDLDNADPAPHAAETARVTVVQPAELPPLPPRAAPEPARAPVPAVRGHAGPILTGEVDRKRIATLRALFGERSIGMIAHYLVLNALAATTALPGAGDAAELRAFALAQEQLLTRALITTRLGRPPAAESVAAPLPPFPPPLRSESGLVALASPPAGSLMLLRPFKEREVLFLGRMVANVDAHPFLRAAQLFVGLCATDIALTDDAVRRRVSTKLSMYAALAASEINRIFLHARLTHAPALFKETHATFDDAAKAVLDALDDVIA